MYEKIDGFTIVSGSLFLFSIVLVSISPAKDLKFSLAEFVIQLGLMVSWTNAIFKANGGEHGESFLSRFVALYTPIIIKLFVIFLAGAFITGVLFAVIGSNFGEGNIVKVETLGEMIFNLAFSFVAYWRIYVAMKAINS